MLDANKLQQAVDQAYTQFHSLNGGQNADYIPFLANVPGQLAAVAIVTCDGNVYSAGDSDYRFALESISKVCTLALALEDVGPQAVQDKIGADPTGLPFNSVIALELHGGKPLSPLVNAGAIATTSLINAENVEQRWQRILHIQQQLAGEQVALSDEVNQSEQTTNFHNRAIAWLLYSAGYLYCDAMEACDVYTRQCSTLLNTIELATLGATLAAGGVNPLTHKRVLQADNVPYILAEMMMEGLYGRSGDWAYRVGLPGKSGVGGGILAVVPGVMGIAAFSPPLDEDGNSVRGQKMVARIRRGFIARLKRIHTSDQWIRSDSCYVNSCRTFLAVLNFELNVLTFSQSFEAITLDSGEVYEHIFAAISRSNEAKTFRLVEPLNLTFNLCHLKNSLDCFLRPQA